MTAQLAKQSLISATLFTVGGNVLGRFFGFLREAVFASYLGTSAIFDTFLLAFTLPELVAMVLFQALPVALIPSAADASRDKERESSLFWSGLLWFALVFAGISAIIYFARVPIFHLLASELTGERAAVGQHLLALLAPYVFFRGMEAYFRSWCFAKKHFVAPATSNIIINSGVMIAVVFFFDRIGIDTLAYGWLAGSFVLMLYNGLSALRLVQPSMRIGQSGHLMTALWRGLLAVAVVESISMIYPMIDRYFAAEYLGPGPISALRYATTLISIPSGIFVAAFNVASFPWIAELTSAGDHDRLRKLYINSVRLLIYGMALASVGIALFAHDIVRAAFQRGAFDAESLVLTTAPLALYALGLIFEAVYTFQLRFYYVKRLYLRIGIVLVFMLLVKIVLSRLLIGTMEHHGLALATSVARMVGFAVLTVDLARSLNVKHSDLFGRFLWPCVVSLVITSLVWVGFVYVWPSTDMQSLWLVFVRLIIAAVIGIGVYLGVGTMLNMAEPRAMAEAIRARMRPSA